MNGLIARTFVSLVLLAYVAVFLALIIAVIRKWLRERPKRRPPEEAGATPGIFHLRERQ